MSDSSGDSSEWIFQGTQVFKKNGKPVYTQEQFQNAEQATYASSSAAAADPHPKYTEQGYEITDDGHWYIFNNSRYPRTVEAQAEAEAAAANAQAAQASASKRVEPSSDNVKAAGASIASILNKEGYKTYGIVGGAAMLFLGIDSSRITRDIDIVVLEGDIKRVKNLLNKYEVFKLSVTERHLTFVGQPDVPVSIDVLAPPKMFLEPFDKNTELYSVTYGGVEVTLLHPIGILNSKSRAVQDRTVDAKKNKDAQDMIFLLGWLHTEYEYVVYEDEVPNCTMEFIRWFIHRYTEILNSSALWELWTSAGCTTNGFPTRET